MKQLYSPRLEATAIRSIASGDDRIAGWLLPRLSAESFSWEPCVDFHRRLMFLTNRHGEIPHWEDLISDLAISEDSRNELTNGNMAEVINTRREARMIVERLEDYRKARALMRMSLHVARTIKNEDKFDISLLTDEAGEMLSKARGGGNMEDAMFSLGLSKIDKRGILEVLNAPKDEFMSTGIRAFDSVNQGVPRGSLWMLAGQTSSGKCSIYSTPVVTSEGIQPIGKIWDTFKTSIDENGFKPADKKLFVQTHTGAVKKITAAYKTKGRPIRVTFSDGSQVTGLPEHKLWINDKTGNPQFRRLDAIQLGDTTPRQSVDAALTKLRNIP